MSASARPRIDLIALKRLAGDRVFARGEAYFRDGLVEILDIDRERVLARVSGSEEYRTELAGRGTAIGGDCSCPAFERDGFCKHLVATALAANAAAACGQASKDSPLSRIREHLRTKSLDALIEMIVEIAERDPELLRKLEIAAAATVGDDRAVEAQLKRAIREATRTRGFVDYRRAADWAGEVDVVLDLLADLASGPRAALAVRLAVDAVDRIEGAIEEIDDSDGHCGVLLGRLRQIHLDACLSARPDPVALARDLFVRETEGEYDTFDGAVALYAEALGEAGLAEYRRLAQEAWEKLPPQVGPRSGGGSGTAGDAFRLMEILDFFAQREGDLRSRVALRAKDLSSPWAYVQLAEFCRTHGLEEEALSHAEEGLWLFEDERPDERLVCCAADLLAGAGRAADAQAHLRRAFERAPSAGLYGQLRSLGGEEAGRQAVKSLQGRLSGRPSTAWEPDADLLVRIMIEEGMLDAAWAVVRDRGTSVGTRQALAAASEETHAREALAVYGERVEELARVGGHAAYEQAAALVARMGRLRDAPEQAAYLEEVRARHGRKRNFMKLLG